MTVLNVDNCSAYYVTTAVSETVKKSKIELRFYPACVTDLVQPSDSFVIQAIKAEWKKRWDQEVMRTIERKKRSDPGSGLGV